MLKQKPGRTDNKYGRIIYSRRNGWPREVYMSDLMNMEDREIKKGIKKEESDKIRDFRKKINDRTYVEHAINRMATDLTHYLTKK